MGVILAAGQGGGSDPTIWGLVVAGVVAVSTAVIGYMTNRRQVKSSDRSQAMDEVTKVWERLDDLEEQLRIERRERQADAAANAKWRRTAVTYINLLTAAWGSGGPIPMLPDDFELD